MARREFNHAEVDALLIACHRRCCVCHRSCGVKIEVDHIEPASGEGSGDISNAIPLCFECHAEVHHYNPQHPKGRRFGPGELRGHRDQWLRLCAERPEMFVHALPSPEAGSLERLLSELEFNRVLAAAEPVGGMFEMIQFRRAIADGTFSWVSGELKASIDAAYRAIVKANASVDARAHRAVPNFAPQADIRAALGPIDTAIARLREAL